MNGLIISQHIFLAPDFAAPSEKRGEHTSVTTVVKGIEILMLQLLSHMLKNVWHTQVTDIIVKHKFWGTLTSYVENMSCCSHYSAPLVLFVCGAFS